MIRRKLTLAAFAAALAGRLALWWADEVIE